MLEAKEGCIHVTFCRLARLARAVLSGGRMRRVDRSFGTMHRIGVLKLNWNRSTAIGKRHFLEDQAQLACLEHGEVSALFALRRNPPGPGSIARVNCVFDIGISARFIQLVIESRRNVFPGRVESDDPVAAAVRQDL